MYPEELCTQIVKGLVDQLKWDGRLRDTATGCVSAVEEAETEILFWDDITGKPLNTEHERSH